VDRLSLDNQRLSADYMSIAATNGEIGILLVDAQSEVDRLTAALEQQMDAGNAALAEVDRLAKKDHKWAATLGRGLERLRIQEAVKALPVSERMNNDGTWREEVDRTAVLAAIGDFDVVKRDERARIAEAVRGLPHAQGVVNEWLVDRAAVLALVEGV
jgi:hypothetical protein